MQTSTIEELKSIMADDTMELTRMLYSLDQDIVSLGVNLIENNSWWKANPTVRAIMRAAAVDAISIHRRHDVGVIITNKLDLWMNQETWGVAEKQLTSQLLKQCFTLRTQK